MKTTKKRPKKAADNVPEFASDSGAVPRLATTFVATETELVVTKRIPPDEIARTVSAAVERHLDESLGPDESEMSATAESSLAGVYDGKLTAPSLDMNPPTRLPWDRGNHFIPCPIRGRLASELLLDPTVNEPLYHVVPRMGAARRLTILVAREKSGKSTLAAYCATVVSIGGSLLGVETYQARVLWIGLEEPVGDAVQRFEKMGADMSRICIVDRLEGANAAEAIAEEIEAYGPALVVIDSLAVLARSRGLAEKSEEGWTDLVTVLRHAAQKAGCTVILLHHARKSDGEYRGSTAIAAAADQIVTLQEEEKDKTVRHVSARGRWSIPDYVIRFDPETLSYTVLDAEASATDSDAGPIRRMLDYVAANPGAGKTIICEQMGVQAIRARSLFDKACEQGEIIRIPDGRGFMLATVAEVVAEGSEQQAA